MNFELAIKQTYQVSQRDLSRYLVSYFLSITASDFSDITFSKAPEAALPQPGGVLSLRTYGEVPLENLKRYSVPESDY